MKYCWTLALAAACTPAAHRTFPCCTSAEGLAVYPLPDPSAEAPSPGQRAAAQTLLDTPGLPPGAHASAVAVALRQHAQSRAFWERAHTTRDTIDTLRELINQADGPEAAIGAAYLSTQLNNDAVSPQCDAGIWQLSPLQSDLIVSDCTLRNGTAWNGRELPHGSMCALTRCRTDERYHLPKATPVAVSGDWLGTWSVSRVVAVYALLTCVTDTPYAICDSVQMP